MDAVIIHVRVHATIAPCCMSPQVLTSSILTHSLLMVTSLQVESPHLFLVARCPVACCAVPVALLTVCCQVDCLLCALESHRMMYPAEPYCQLDAVDSIHIALCREFYRNWLFTSEQCQVVPRCVCYRNLLFTSGRCQVVPRVPRCVCVLLKSLLCASNHS